MNSKEEDARLIWLCACVRYCRPRGWCLSMSLAVFVCYLNVSLFLLLVMKAVGSICRHKLSSAKNMLPSSNAVAGLHGTSHIELIGKIHQEWFALSRSAPSLYESFLCSCSVRARANQARANLSPFLLSKLLWIHVPITLQPAQRRLWRCVSAEPDACEGSGEKEKLRPQKSACCAS